MDLIKIFANVSGASFVGLDTLTEVGLTGGRSNDMQGRIQKRMTGASIMVFQNKNINGYEAMVQRRLIKEGKSPFDFQLAPRPWGIRLENLPVVLHNDQLYLEAIFLNPGTIEYLFDGKPILMSAIIGLKEAKANEEGGLRDKVIIRIFKADSITAIRIDGVEYR